MLAGVFIESGGAEASLMDRKQGLTELSLFVKDDERNHLETIIGVTAYLNPSTLGIGGSRHSSVVFHLNL